MERTVALGLLIAGITPISLASSTVVEPNNHLPIVDLVRSTTASSSAQSCLKLDSTASCFSTTLVEPRQPQSWSQKITDSWLSNTPWSNCGKQSTAKADSIYQFLGFGQHKIGFSQSNQSIVASRTSTRSVLPSFGKLAQKCVSSQRQLERQLDRSDSIKVLNHSSKSLHRTSLPKFPKLSRSSLIVSFPVENSSFVPGIGKLANPAPETKRIASGFGWRRRPYSNQLQFHQGIDYGAPYGSNVVAVGSGIVTKVVSGCVDFGNLFCGGQLGNWIEIDHGDGVIGTYGHLKGSSITVKEGMKVRKNQHIAQVGSSGWSTGAHLDFRLKVNGKHEDPAEYVMGLSRK